MRKVHGEAADEENEKYGIATTEENTKPASFTRADIPK